MKNVLAGILVAFTTGACCSVFCNEEESGAGASFAPVAGGDCVLLIRPDTVGGPEFSMTFKFDGNGITTTSGDTQHSIDISSDEDDLVVGTASGSQKASATQGVPYTLDITDLAGTPTAELENLNTGAKQAVSLSEVSISSPIADGFQVMARDYSSGGTDYIRVFVLLGGEGASFDVTKP